MKHVKLYELKENIVEDITIYDEILIDTFNDDIYFPIKKVNLSRWNDEIHLFFTLNSDTGINNEYLEDLETKLMANKYNL